MITDDALNKLLEVLQRDRAALADCHMIAAIKGRPRMDTLQTALDDYDACIRYVRTELRIRDLRRKKGAA